LGRESLRKEDSVPLKRSRFPNFSSSARVLLCVIGGAVAALGAAILIVALTRASGALELRLVVCFGAGLAVLFLSRLFLLSLRIDSAGVEVRGFLSKHKIPWSKIEGFDIERNVQWQSALDTPAIRLTDGQTYLAWFLARHSLLLWLSDSSLEGTVNQLKALQQAYKESTPDSPS